MKKIILLIIICLTNNLQSQLIPFRLNNLWGFSDSKGILKIQPQFQFADFFTQGIAFIKKDSFYYGINTKGDIITKAIKRYGRFEYGHCPVMFEGDSTYYIGYDGKISIPIKFDAAENFSENLAVVSIKKKLGIIDVNGKWIRKPDFDTSSLYFKSGHLMAISKGKYFYINRRGENLALADSIQVGDVFSEGLAPVYVNKSRNSLGQLVNTTFLEFIDSTGQIVLSHFKNEGIDYSEYIMLETGFRDGKAIIKSRNEIAWDYYFIDKQKHFSSLYASARHLGNHLFLGAIGHYMSDIRILDSNYYVSGQFQNKPTQVGQFGDGLLPFRDKEGNWGYIDDNCNLMIEAKYDAAFTFINGYAFVVIKGNTGVINTNGKEFFYDTP